MIHRLKKVVLPLALSALCTFGVAGEVVLQNGLDGYSGCEDASLFNSTVVMAFDEADYAENDGYLMGDATKNFDHIPFLSAYFCPS